MLYIMSHIFDEPLYISVYLFFVKTITWPLFSKTVLKT